MHYHYIKILIFVYLCLVLNWKQSHHQLYFDVHIVAHSLSHCPIQMCTFSEKAECTGPTANEPPDFTPFKNSRSLLRKNPVARSSYMCCCYICCITPAAAFQTPQRICCQPLSSSLSRAPPTPPTTCPPTPSAPQMAAGTQQLPKSRAH